MVVVQKVVHGVGAVEIGAKDHGRGVLALVECQSLGTGTVVVSRIIGGHKSVLPAGEVQLFDVGVCVIFHADVTDVELARHQVRESDVNNLAIGGLGLNLAGKGKEGRSKDCQDGIFCH